MCKFTIKSFIITSDTLICRGNQILTGSVGKNVRIWSVVGVGEMRLPGDHGNIRSGGLTMEDEMTLDGGIVAAAFDEVMDMVNKITHVQLSDIKIWRGKTVCLSKQLIQFSSCVFIWC